MPETENYEILVIGSGEAGKYLAWTMAGAGHRMAVIERQLVGGSCPNIACLPSKNIIHSAKVRSMIGGVPYTTLRNGIFTHPTVGEGLTVLLSNPPTTPAP